MLSARKALSTRPHRRFFQTPRLKVYCSSARSSRGVRCSMNRLLLGRVRPVNPWRFTKVQRFKSFGVRPHRGRLNRKLRQGMGRAGSLECKKTARLSFIRRVKLFLFGVSMLEKSDRKYRFALNARRVKGCANGTAYLFGRHQRLCFECER